MIVDVSTFVGPYPFRHLDRTTPEGLLHQMDRVGIDRAWVAHLPSILYRDPAPGTAELLRWLTPYRDRLRPIPTVHPGLPRWEDDLNFAAAIDAPAVRVHPGHQGLEPAGDAMRVVAVALAALDLPLHLAVRLEDARQRHPLDTAPDLPAAAVRTLVRVDDRLRILVSNADRGFIEEVHFGLTPAEAQRVLWDIAWLWGPPDDQLATLVGTVGIGRFTLGTGMPLRLPEGPFAKVDLLDLHLDDRARLLGGALDAWG